MIRRTVSSVLACLATAVLTGCATTESVSTDGITIRLVHESYERVKAKAEARVPTEEDLLKDKAAINKVIARHFFPDYWRDHKADYNAVGRELRNVFKPEKARALRGVYENWVAREEYKKFKQ